MIPVVQHRLSPFGSVVDKKPKFLNRCIFLSRLLPRNCFPLIVADGNILHTGRCKQRFLRAVGLHWTAGLSNVFSEE